MLDPKGVAQYFQNMQEYDESDPTKMGSVLLGNNI